MVGIYALIVVLSFVKNPCSDQGSKVEQIHINTILVETSISVASMHAV